MVELGECHFTFCYVFNSQTARTQTAEAVAQQKKGVIFAQLSHAVFKFVEVVIQCLLNQVKIHTDKIIN